MVRSAILTAAMAVLCLAATAQAYDERPLDIGWRMKQDNAIAGAESPAFDDSSWQKVDLPHTWNHIGNLGNTRSPQSNSTQGTGWYRLNFRAAPAMGKRYFMQFDGVGEIADVWLNGQYLGRHMGAFQRFRFDATKALKPGGDNVLVVKADNSRPAPGSSTQDIIPLSGDFFIHGGIYRQVSLITTDPVHIDLMDFGGPGVYARATAIAGDTASVEVRNRLANDGAGTQKVSVETRIEDGSGASVAVETDADTLKNGVTEDRHVLQIKHPHLWDGVTDPYLYRVVVTVRDAKGAVLDMVVQPLGLRSFRFDANTGFYLNGHPVQMRGASRHQDRPPGIGWAITKADISQDFDLMQDMGANAVRLAHYQHDQFAYEETDRRGLMVWAEIPLVNAVSYDGSPPNAAFVANSENQFRELIRQNYNHPSIIMWSVGNETDLTPTQQKTTSKQGALIKALSDIGHAEDPGRVTTLADCCERLDGKGPNDAPGAQVAPRDQVVGLTDVAGYNRYYGWYVGKPADFGPFLDQAHAVHDALPIGVSEYGAGGALSQHTDNPLGGPIAPKGRPHPEEYESWYHEQSWPQIAKRPYIWGVFIWNMFDFSSDSRAEGEATDINDKGMVSGDRAVRKDVFYYYRANWNAEPTLHINGRRYIDRAYAVTDVSAYSNAHEARLSVNGADMGNTVCSGGICVWPKVHLQPGGNSVNVAATINGAVVSDSVLWQFNGDPKVVNIHAGSLEGFITADGERFGSDNFFTGGQGHNTQGAIAAGDPALYSSYREGMSGYDIPVPDGDYYVRFSFIEPSASKPGERVFDISINGTVVRPALDVFTAAGGKLAGVDTVVKAQAKGGALHIGFTPRAGQPVISGIEVAPAN